MKINILIFYLILCGKIFAAHAWLHTAGTSITNSNGKTILLHGVNFGAWLLNEMWMTDFEPRGSNLTCDADIRHTLIKRFGSKKAGQLLQVFQDSYINEQDFKKAKELGFNCIRLPFFYKILEDDGSIGVYKKRGWRLLDFAISNCAANNIYCILDLHGAPGGQSADHTTGQTGFDKLFKNKTFQDRTVRLWTAVAKRYKEEPAVAGYDFLNEPFGAPSINSLLDLYDKIYRAVRAVDKKHIIFLSDRGTWHGGLNEFPPPKKLGWENVVYQTHLYDFKNWGFAAHKKLIDDFKKNNISKKNNTPVFIGEFHPQGNYKLWKFYLRQFSSNNWNWALWAYKCSKRAGDWGLFRTDVSPNILKDSFQTLSNKFLHYDTRFSTFDKKQLDVFKSACSRCD